MQQLALSAGGKPSDTNTEQNSSDLGRLWSDTVCTVENRKQVKLALDFHGCGGNSPYTPVWRDVQEHTHTLTLWEKGGQEDSGWRWPCQATQVLMMSKQPAVAHEQLQTSSHPDEINDSHIHPKSAWWSSGQPYLSAEQLRTQNWRIRWRDGAFNNAPTNDGLQ